MHQIACMTQNTEEIGKEGFLTGYNGYTITVIFLQAVVGLVSAPGVATTRERVCGSAVTLSIFQPNTVTTITICFARMRSLI